jgi:MFS family permease
MHRRVVAVSLVMALQLLGDSLLYVVLPLHAGELGFSGFQVGVLLSANRFVRMLTNRGASRLMRRLAVGPLFTAATVLGLVTTAVYGFEPAFLIFLLARLAWGVAFSALRLGCFVTVLDAATDRTRGRLMGLYQSISRAGSFVATVAGGALFDVYGYRTAVFVMAAGTALATPLAIAGGAGGQASGANEGDGGRGLGDGEGAGAADERTGSSGTGAMVRRGGVSRVRDRRPSQFLAVKVSAFALSFVARGVVTATLALFLQRAFGDHFGPGGAIGVATVASWLIGVRWAADIGLAAPLGALSDRIGRAPALLGWLIVTLTMILTLALAPSIGVAVAAAVGLFVASSGLGATLDAAAGDLAPPDRRAETMSSYADWADLGAAFGPLVALSVADSVGLRPSYLAGSVLLGIGAAAVVVAFRSRSVTTGGQRT